MNDERMSAVFAYYEYVTPILAERQTGSAEIDQQSSPTPRSTALADRTTAALRGPLI